MPVAVAHRPRFDRPSLTARWRAIGRQCPVGTSNNPGEDLPETDTYRGHALWCERRIQAFALGPTGPATLPANGWRRTDEDEP